MSNGESYTAVLQQIYSQLGRLEGKLDAYDTRLRVTENQIAAWQELVKSQASERETWVRWRKEVDTFRDHIGRKIAYWGGASGIIGLVIGYAVRWYAQ